MGDLKSKKLIFLKAALFLISGLVAATLIFIESPSLKVAVLLAITVWCFCRCYYFAFYVIEKYVDGNYKFAGLIDFAKYLLGKRK